MTTWIKPKDEIKNSGEILARKFYHKLLPNGHKAVTNTGIVRVGGEDWEVFRVSSETRDAYYGMPLEGLGMFDCMILKTDTRLFLDTELEFWKNQQMGMYGSHSGNLSYGFKVSLIQCVPVWVDKNELL